MVKLDDVGKSSSITRRGYRIDSVHFWIISVPNQCFFGQRSITEQCVRTAPAVGCLLSISLPCVSVCRTQGQYADVRAMYLTPLMCRCFEGKDSMQMCELCISLCRCASYVSHSPCVSVCCRKGQYADVRAMYLTPLCVGVLQARTVCRCAS